MKITNYTIKQSIGQGGMATVYFAEHNIFQKPVAIKVLNKEFVHNENIRKRFLAEAKNLFGMSHPNIIKVIDLIDDGDTVAFVMEYIAGETLKDYLDKKKKLSENKIKEIFSQMLDAVSYVHDQGLVHRDIKPSNFMITAQGQIKLLDFGIAKNTDTQSSDYTQTGTMQNMGTPMYMSPEQIKSTKDVTSQSDIYSLGVVLWQMVMGKKPYDTNTTSTFELQTKIVTEKLSSTNSLFEPIIELATAKELKNRYKNCKEIKLQLENLQKQDSEKTIAYTDQNSEKTIVDNSKDNTVLEVNENKPSAPKPQADVPYYFPPKKDNTLLFVILGIVGVIIIGGIIFGIILVNKNSYYPPPYVSSGDSVSVASDSASVGLDTTAVAAPAAASTKIVSFSNNTSNAISLAYGFWDNNDWESIGWYTIEPNNSQEIYLPDSFTENEIYWYAKNSNGALWEGSDAYLCVNPTDAFQFYSAENCNVKEGFRKLNLTGYYTTQSLWLND